MGLESKQTTALMSRSKKKSLDCVSLGDSLKLGLSLQKETFQSYVKITIVSDQRILLW